jgi:hypothetical protein
LSQPLETTDIDSLVKTRFRVKDKFVLPENEMEYKVEYDPSSKKAFEKLWSELNTLGYTPRLFGSREDASLVVGKKQAPKVSRSMFPVLFMGLTAASIIGFGLIWIFFYQELAPGTSPYFVMISYCASVTALLVARELGHRHSAAKAGMGPTTPLAIPGVPGFTAFLPCVGVVSLLREPAINRDSLVDFALLGPMIALALSLVLYTAGDFVWVQSAITLQAAQSSNSIIGIQTINPSLMQAGIDSLVSPLVRSVPAGYARLSPLLDAGTVGFFMTFLNLLPITHFDGGNAFANAFSGRGLRITTVVCAVALAMIDTPNYLFLALFVLLIAGRQTDVQCLDEISPASSSRKAFFFIALALALLCLPFPQKVLTLNL